MKKVLNILFIMMVVFNVANASTNTPKLYHSHQVINIPILLPEIDNTYKFELCQLINGQDSIYTTNYIFSNTELNYDFKTPIFTEPVDNLFIKVYRLAGYGQIENDTLWQIEDCNLDTFNVVYNFKQPTIELVGEINYTRPYILKIKDWDNPNIKPSIYALQTGIINQTEYTLPVEIFDINQNENYFKFTLNINSNFIRFELKLNDVTFHTTQEYAIQYNNIESTINEYKNLVMQLQLINDSLNKEIANLKLINDSLMANSVNVIYEIGNIYFENEDVNGIGIEDRQINIKDMESIYAQNKILNISFLPNYNKIGIKLFNLQGVILKSFQSIDSDIISFDEFASGSYILLIVTKQGNESTVKWIKLLI